VDYKFVVELKIGIVGSLGHHEILTGGRGNTLKKKQ